MCIRDRCIINPELTFKSDDLVSYEEGCLSIPGFNETIARPDKIKLIWQNLSGETMEDTPEGILTVCIQHEIDHLNGVLFIDHISKIKRKMAVERVLKQKKKKKN